MDYFNLAVRQARQAYDYTPIDVPDNVPAQLAPTTRLTRREQNIHWEAVRQTLAYVRDRLTE